MLLVIIIHLDKTKAYYQPYDFECITGFSEDKGAKIDQFANKVSQSI